MSDLKDDETSKKRKTKEAICWYGAFAVVLGGGAGVWLPLIIPGKTLASDGLATYVFAILAPLLADAVLHEPYWKKLSKIIKMRLVALCGLAAALAIAALLRGGQSWDWTAGLLGMAVSLVVWFFISLYSGRFEPDETIPTTGSLGGTEVTPAHLNGGGLQ
ncbi:MAG: hypothetical protein HGA96_17640 [Desulfobulbaceae bacterium]|nr:hypothetical protein [Desulfobulbaceae bacterium]